MRTKKRYFLVYMNDVASSEEFEKRIFAVINRLSPLLAIRANVRIVKELTINTDGGFFGVISVNNVYKEEVIFILSLIGKFYKANLLTLKSSGSLKKLRLEEARHGTNAE